MPQGPLGAPPQYPGMHPQVLPLQQQQQLYLLLLLLQAFLLLQQDAAQSLDA